MDNLVKKVFTDENFPSHPRKQIGIEIVKGKEQPIYTFYLDQKDAYVVENNDVSKFYTNGTKVFKDCVCLNFNDSNNNPMRYLFWFSTYNLDEWYIKNGKPAKGNFEMLLMATEKI